LPLLCFAKLFKLPINFRYVWYYTFNYKGCVCTLYMMMNCDIHLYTISTVSAQQFKLRMTSKKMYILFRNPLQWYCHSQCIAEVFASVEQKSTLWHWQHAALPSTNASLWPLDQFSRVNPFEVITLSATSWCQRRSFITQLFYNFCTYTYYVYMASWIGTFFFFPWGFSW